MIKAIPRFYSLLVSFQALCYIAIFASLTFPAKMEGFSRKPDHEKLVDVKAWKFYISGIHASPAMKCRDLETKKETLKMYIGIELCFTRNFDPADCPK